MIPDGYRIMLAYDSERNIFVARVPEIGDVKGEGSTRAEALSNAEECVEKAFREAAEQGKEMPVPLDTSEFTGELKVLVSPSLHREVTFLASREGIAVDQLVSEMLSAELVSRFAGRVRTSPATAEPNHREGRKRGDERRGTPRGDRYFNIMDDRASFMEYVRGLEPGGRRGSGRGRGRR